MSRNAVSYTHLDVYKRQINNNTNINNDNNNNNNTFLYNKFINVSFLGGGSSIARVFITGRSSWVLSFDVVSSARSVFRSPLNPHLCLKARKAEHFSIWCVQYYMCTTLLFYYYYILLCKNIIEYNILVIIH